MFPKWKYLQCAICRLQLFPKWKQLLQTNRHSDWNDGSCFYLIVIQTGSPLSLASTIFCLRRWSQMRLSRTLPTSRFLPTRIQPSVSSEQLPAWMRMPSEQDGKPLLELRRERDDYCIATFRDGRAAFYLVGPVGVVAPSRFEGVAEI